MTVLILAGLAGIQLSMATDLSVSVRPAAPENASVVHNNVIEVELTWDASPTPVSSIESYTIFYKKQSEPDFPLLPQITRLDSLANYSEAISVDFDTAYDFIVFANTYSGTASTEDCASCKASNSTCGNIVIDPGEECDGTELNGLGCTDFGYVSGTLGCSASCVYDYTACYTPGSGSGGGSSSDTIDPIPGIASSPEFTNLLDITVTYSGASDIGGSGLSSVNLYYKKNLDPWKYSGLSSTTSSGSFNFTLDDDPNARYYFDLKAYDNDGNSSGNVTDQGDTSTILDRELPTISTINIPESAINTPITITYVDAIDNGLSGLENVELWYKFEKDGSWIDSTLRSTGSSGSFSFDSFGDSGVYYFDLIAVDKAGNRSIEDFEYVEGTIYDIDAPIVSFISVPAVSSSIPITVSYEDAKDVGLSGLKSVELWYRFNEDGVWTNSGLVSTKENDSFEFNMVEFEGIYFFNLVLEDNFGNRSFDITGDGMTSVHLILGEFTASLSNLPESITIDNSTDIDVGGDGIIAYKYSLDGGVYSDEQLINSSITLSGLTEGNHSIDVIGKHEFGVWQSENKATNYTWRVDYTSPSVEIIGPLSDTTIYSLSYKNADVITLGLDDITLNKSGSATGVMELSIIDTLTRQVTITDISGVGTLSITVAEGTASYSNGNLAPSVGPSNEIIIEEDKKINSLFNVFAKPEGRKDGNFSYNGSLEFYDLSTSTIRNILDITADNSGIVDIASTEIGIGDYKVSLKAKGYLRTIIPNIKISDDAEILLDYTFDNSSNLIGGDVWEDSIINSSDIAKLISTYMSSDVQSDLNRDGYVNAPDMALVIKNYHLQGNQF